MWDWIKASAGEALKRGAEYIQHATALQQIMNAPSYEHATIALRQHVHSLGDQRSFNGFMQVVKQTVRHAELELQQALSSPSGPSWGSSFEDQMAQGMAELRAGATAGNSPRVRAAAYSFRT